MPVLGARMGYSHLSREEAGEVEAAVVGANAEDTRLQMHNLPVVLPARTGRKRSARLHREWLWMCAWLVTLGLFVFCLFVHLDVYRAPQGSLVPNGKPSDDCAKFFHTSYSMASLTHVDGKHARTKVDEKLPMVKLFGARKVTKVLAAQEQWLPGIIHALDECSQNDTSATWSRFNFFGRVYDLCPHGMLQSFGQGDSQKKICNLNNLIKLSNGHCEIVSIGSGGKWEFEEDVFKSTSCKVHTFDCTLTNEEQYRVPDDIASRVLLYNKCIHSRRDFGRRPSRDYLPYEMLLDLAGITHAPTFLKMDVEGFEWNVLADITGAGVRSPQQLSFELHYHKLMASLKWRRSYKNPAELALLGDMVFGAGYVALHRRDNIYGSMGEAAEYLLAKIASGGTL